MPILILAALLLFINPSSSASVGGKRFEINEIVRVHREGFVPRGLVLGRTGSDYIVRVCNGQTRQTITTTVKELSRW